jgi:hypothetical protein
LEKTRKCNDFIIKIAMSLKENKFANYDSIGHLPGSKIGEGDRTCDRGQAKIATVKIRDKHDRVIVQEKLDGGNVGVALIDGILYPLTRSGYLACESFLEQHWRFSEWVYSQQDRFMAVLEDGERLCGEWLLQAHGTRYHLQHEPFVAFDLMNGNTRTPHAEFLERLKPGAFVSPKVIHEGEALSIEKATALLNVYGFHGAIDPVEGAVWRVERNKETGIKGQREWVVNFVVKHVRPEKNDGCYLPFISKQPSVWNTYNLSFL